MESDFVAFPFIIGKAIYKKGEVHTRILEICWVSVHRFWISGPDLGIDVGFCLFMPCCVHRFLNSGPDFHHFQVLQYP